MPTSLQGPAVGKETRVFRLKGSMLKEEPEFLLEEAGEDDKMAAAAAKSLQLCPTLCDPIDGSPRGMIRNKLELYEVSKIINYHSTS